MNRLLFYLFLMSCLAACRQKSDMRTAMSAAFDKAAQPAGETYDLPDIRRGGELIIATLSGPETYYEYHGVGMGLQYALAENFAETEGMRLRVETAPDTAALLRMVLKGEADLLALPIPLSQIRRQGLEAAGVNNDTLRLSWAVKKTTPLLAQALRDWFEQGVELKVQRTVEERARMIRHVTRRPQAVYLSRARGIISVYDHLFKQASAQTGWDWRLIAAQAYQESAFDPNARSWAGAQGLMQLMPRTAEELGLQPQEVHRPERNVDAAARYIRRLTSLFADVRDAQERIKFVLAAYNGGHGHVRDAMALARKYGKDERRWTDVAPFVLGLQSPKYYRDPVVKHGYMIGSETEAYVRNILERYRDYGGHVMLDRSAAPLEAPPTPTVAEGGQNKSAPRKNKYSSGVRLLSPDDPEFHQMNR